MIVKPTLDERSRAGDRRQRLGAWSVGVVTLLALTASACAPQREAIYADTGLSEVLIGDLVLMPIADHRAERLDHGFDIGREIHDAAGKVLAKKGYSVTAATVLDSGSRMPAGGFEGLSESELAVLGPVDSKMLVFIAVTGVDKGYDRGGDEYMVRLTAIVVDRASSRVIWRDNGSGNSNFGGLLAVMTPAGRRYDAVYEALVNLFKTVPDRDRPSEGPRRKLS
jgi:hypothetical protein